MQRANVIIDTLNGSMTLGEAIVRKAVQFTEESSTHPLQVSFKARPSLHLSPTNGMGTSKYRIM